MLSELILVTDLSYFKRASESVEMERWCLYIYMVLLPFEGLCLFPTVTLWFSDWSLFSEPPRTETISALSLQLQCQYIAALNKFSSLYSPSENLSPPCL